MTAAHLDAEIVAVLEAAGGRFERPAGWAATCLAEHVPAARTTDVLRRIQALAAAGRIKLTAGGPSHSSTVIELVAS